MVKYHISRDGAPGICTAKSRCPLGGPEKHFSSFEEAQAYADKKNKSELSKISHTWKSKPVKGKNKKAKLVKPTGGLLKEIKEIFRTGMWLKPNTVFNPYADKESKDESKKPKGNI